MCDVWFKGEWEIDHHIRVNVPYSWQGVCWFFNPFTAKSSQKQISTKFSNIVLWNFEKQIAPFVSIGGELSFEWSYHRISSADSIVRVTLQNSIKHSHHAKKVMSNSPGLVDFAIGLVNSVLNLPDGQVMFFEKFE